MFWFIAAQLLHAKWTWFLYYIYYVFQSFTVIACKYNTKCLFMFNLFMFSVFSYLMLNQYNDYILIIIIYMCICLANLKLQINISWSTGSHLQMINTFCTSFGLNKYLRDINSKHFKNSKAMNKNICQYCRITKLDLHLTL